MPAGIQIIGDSGTIQIDENYNNLFLVATGVGGTIPAISNYINPLLALQLTSLSTGSYYNFGSAVPAGIRWFVFDQLQGVHATNVGFQVFNASGGLIFDAGCKPLRLVYANANLTGSGSVGLAAGRTYATIMGSHAGRWTEGSIKSGSANWRNFEGEEYIGCTINGSTLAWNWYWRFYSEWISDTQEFAQGTNVINYNIPASVLVVDVSNYY